MSKLQLLVAAVLLGACWAADPSIEAVELLQSPEDAMQAKGLADESKQLASKAHEAAAMAVKTRVKAEKAAEQTAEAHAKLEGHVDKMKELEEQMQGFKKTVSTNLDKMADIKIG